MSDSNNKGERVSFFSSDSLLRSIGILCLVIGGGLFIAGIFLILFNVEWGEILFQVGEFLLASVLLSFFVNVARYMGAFKQDLKDILHSEEHSSELSTIVNNVINSEETKHNYFGALQRIIYGKDFVPIRKDIDKIWDNVTLELFEDRFPGIERGLLEGLKNYFPKDELYYYSDHEIQYVLTWEDKEQGLIRVKEVETVDVISKTKGKIVYDFSTRNDVQDGSPYTCNLTSLFIDGNPCTPEQLKPTTERGNGFYQDSWNIELEGKTKYSIRYNREEVYKLTDDFFIGFWAKRTVDGLRVTMTHPNDIKARLIPRGVLNAFEPSSSDGIITETNTTIAKKYNGLILYKQGYIISLFSI